MPVSGNLYYSLHGDQGTENPPLVLIHGAGGNHLYWPPTIRRLPEYRVYAVDLPGHGESKRYDGRQTVGEYADILIQWLEAIRLRRAILVGHSLGGAIALSIAIHQPEYALGLGLISSGARLRVHPDLLKYAADPTTYINAANLLVAYSFSPHARPRLVELATKRLLETRQSVFWGDLLACDRFDVMGQLSAVSLPTLVVCGNEDQMTPVRHAQYLANNIPAARLDIVPNAGHMVMLEQPHLVAESLLSFLRDIAFHPGEGF